MITHSIDITIARPVEAVFAFLTDATNHPRWDRSSIAMEPQQPGPWRAGLTFRDVRRIGPRTIEVRSIVADLVPGSSFDLQSLSGPPFQGHWRFAAEGGGTRLRWTGEMQLTGPARLFEPLIARAFRRHVDADFARLKELLEREG